MNVKDSIRSTMDLSQKVLRSYISDLSDADLMQRPGPGCNHLAWQLGHLISSEAGLLNMVRAGSGPELPAGFAEQHNKETCGIDDPAKFLTKAQYIEQLDRVNAASKALLADYPDADFDLPAPEWARQMCPTMGSFFGLIATHPMMHAGQFVPVRRALGKPVVI